MIDLSNPQVLKNHAKSQMLEGKGKFDKRTVIVFTADNGMEFICPQEIFDMYQKMQEEKQNGQAAKKSVQAKKD